MEDALEGDEDGYLRQSPEVESTQQASPGDITPKSAIVPSLSDKSDLTTIPTPKTANLLSPIPQAQVPKQPKRQTSLPLPDYFDLSSGKPVSETSSTQGVYTPSISTPGVVTPGGTITGSKSRRPIFKRNKSRTQSSGVDTPGLSGGVSTGGGRKLRRRDRRNFNFDSSQGRDVLGIVIMEIKNASDLPKIKNCELPGVNTSRVVCRKLIRFQHCEFHLTWIPSSSSRSGRRCFEPESFDIV